MENIEKERFAATIIRVKHKTVIVVNGCCRRYGAWTSITNAFLLWSTFSTTPPTTVVDFCALNVKNHMVDGVVFDEDDDNTDDGDDDKNNRNRRMLSTGKWELEHPETCHCPSCHTHIACNWFQFFCFLSLFLCLLCRQLLQTTLPSHLLLLSDKLLITFRIIKRRKRMKFMSMVIEALILQKNFYVLYNIAVWWVVSLFSLKFFIF